MIRSLSALFVLLSVSSLVWAHEGRSVQSGSDAVQELPSGKSPSPPPIYYEEAPSRSATLDLDGSTHELPCAVKWRAICGSDTTGMTVDDLKEIIRRGRETRAANPPMIIGGEASPRGGMVLTLQASGFPAAANTALQQCKTYVESQFTDPVSVTITLSWTPLGGGTLGATGASFLRLDSYANARNSLANFADDDDSIEANLPTTTLPVRYDGNVATVTDETRCFSSVANYRAAFGSVSGNAADMVINSNVAWDFAPENGVSGSLMEFQSVIIHEIAHALGFDSNTDNPGGNQFILQTDVMILDFYRFQRTDGTLNYNPDTLQQFTTTPRLVDLNVPNDQHISDLISGEYRMSDGNPYQAAHFREQFPIIGIMGPAQAPGETYYPNYYQPADLAALDALGWDHVDRVTPAPPNPSPMQFLIAPLPTGTDAVLMTAVQATDSSDPPVQYFFDFVAGGSGGTDSAWQASQSYSDFGLAANGFYSYQVRARDSAVPAPYETLNSPVAFTATRIETPSGIQIGAITDTTIALTALGPLSNLDIAPSGLYFDTLPPALGVGTQQWVQSTSMLISGLQPGTTYSFHVKARNRFELETDWSPTVVATTTTSNSNPADCDGNGTFNALLDTLCFVNALRGIETVPPGGIARSDLNHDGRADGKDITIFVNCALGHCP